MAFGISFLVLNPRCLPRKGLKLVLRVKGALRARIRRENILPRPVVDFFFVLTDKYLLKVRPRSYVMLSLEHSSSSIGLETLKIVPSSVSCSFEGRVTACATVWGSRAVNTASLVLLEELQFCPGLRGR